MTMSETKVDKTVCVFCGSSFGNNKVFAESATDLGREIALKNWGLVYGGGTTGLMGAVAKSCIENGSTVHGIIPNALVSKERSKSVEEYNEILKESVDNHKGITPLSEEYGRTTIVPDMHTRKRKMGEEADAFIALPGGFGTLEELMEVVTWNQLGIHGKPIILFNVDGFFDELIVFIKKSVENGFISEKNGEIIKIGNTSKEVLNLIETYKVPDGRYNLNWENLGTKK